MKAHRLVCHSTLGLRVMKKKGLFNVLLPLGITLKLLNSSFLGIFKLNHQAFEDFLASFKLFRHV